MTVQSTFYTAENTKGWFLVDVDDIDENMVGELMMHPILQWKMQGLDAPPIPVTAGGGPTLITRSTEWFVWNSETCNLYGMDKSGCWLKTRTEMEINAYTRTTIKNALKTRSCAHPISSVQEDNYAKET